MKLPSNATDADMGTREIALNLLEVDNHDIMKQERTHRCVKINGLSECVRKCDPLILGLQQGNKQYSYFNLNTFIPFSVVRYLMDEENNGSERHHVHLQHPPHWRLLETQGTFTKLHPTHARYHDPHLDTSIHWSARRHRKGRNVQVLSLPSPILLGYTS